MKKTLNIFWMVFLMAPALPLSAVTITFTIDPTQNNNPISPYIYGSNSSIPNVKNTYYRSGGNRLSAYNWETNWSNAGSDYLYENDTLMGTRAQGPGYAYTSFHTQNKANGADSLVTIPMAGYVSANGEPAVQVPNADFMNAPGLTDPHGNFFPISFVKPGFPGSYADPPNLTDGAVYDDEMVNFLVKHLGGANSGGIKFYDLDNEPGAWPSTHAEVHNYPVSYLEVANKSITVAEQTTAIDPGAQLLGPVGYGWGDFINLSGAPDHATYDATYNNGNWVSFLNYYLAKMQAASNAAGRRLLHYLDSHVYSEGTDAAGNRINNGDVSQDAATTRMQLPREMWDPSFTENNWISCCVAYGPMTLIPRLQAAINQYYPGTKIAFTEYDYGGGGDISGGIAEADFLGVLTKYPNMLASLWDVGAGTQYLTCAFNFYLNYDGTGTHFGDTSVLANSNNVPEATVYAAKDSAHPNHLNVIILNKDYSANNTASVTLSGLGTAQISSIRAFRFDSAISVITASTAPTFTANTFTDTLPFRSATLYEVTLNQTFATFTPTTTGTFTFTPTFTRTSTSSPTSTATPTGTLPTSTFTPTRTSTPTVTFSPTPTVVCASLFNSCDSLTANGTWNGTNATRSISTANMTQGTGDLQVNVTTASGWNTQILNLTGFSPNVWNNVAQVAMDVYVSPSLISGGSTYHQLTLLADSASLGQQSISDYPTVNSGANSVTFNITFTGAGFPATTPLTQLWFVYNTDSTGTGSFYVDNIRLVQACVPTPTNTPSGPTPTVTFTRTFTATFTRTFTPTFTSTFTNSFTYTPTFTPTASRTPTFTNTPVNSSTFTPTPTNSLTYTPTFTLTASRTPTFTNTPVNSPTFTPTSTFTASPTPTSTNSFTATPTQSFTPTPTRTSTATLSPTPTFSFTNSPTITSTSTNSPTGTLSPSNTPTNTPTFTISLTSTNSFTSTYTLTRTFTPIPTNTPTASPTHTAIPSNTFTWTFTASFSNTSTATATFTHTPTNTGIPTNTTTWTLTHTPTSTATASSTPSPTSTSTNSPVPPTSTATLTFTSTGTASMTPTTSYTPTPTATSAPLTLILSPGPSAPPSSTQNPGNSNVPVIQVLVTNPGASTVILTGITINSDGTGNPATGVTSISLFNNVTLLQTGNFTGTTVVFNGLSLVIPPGRTVTLQVNVDLSVTAAPGTYPFSLTGATGTGSQAIGFNGIPYNGATISISGATWTPTPNPTEGTSPVLYPNPADGTKPVSIHVPGLAGPADIKVQIFTTAFRKVQEKIYQQQPAAKDLVINLTDSWNAPLASGLYYVVISATPLNGGAPSHTIGKLLILR